MRTNWLLFKGYVRNFIKGPKFKILNAPERHENIQKLKKSFMVAVMKKEVTSTCGQISYLTVDQG